MEMSPWIENACITIMLISLVINNIGAYSSVELDKSNCDTKILYISRDIKQTIEWQGDTVIPSYCRVGFEDTDDNPYSICIKFKAFRILACDFAIKVYKDLSKLSIKTYDCVSEDVNDRCFDSKNIYLGFLSNYTGGYTNTKVKIEVYAKEDAETVPILGNIIGGTVVSVFLCCGLFILYQICKGESCFGECKTSLDAICECSSILLRAAWKAIVDFWCSEEEVPRDETGTGRENVNNGQTLFSSQPHSPEPEVVVPAEHTMNLTRGSSISSIVSLEFDDMIAAEVVRTALPHDESISVSSGDTASVSSEDSRPDPDSGACSHLHTSLPDAPPPSYYDVVAGNNLYDK